MCQLRPKQVGGKSRWHQHKKILQDGKESAKIILKKKCERNQIIV